MADADAVEVGTAYATILPSAKGFAKNLRKEIAKEFAGSKLDKAIDAALAGASIGVPVRPEFRDEDIPDRLPALPVEVDPVTDGLRRDLRKQLDAITKQVTASIAVTPETDQLRTDLSAAITAVEASLTADIPTEPADRREYERRLREQVDGVSRTVRAHIEADVHVDEPALGRTLGRVDVDTDGRSLGARLGQSVLSGLLPVGATIGVALGTSIGSAAVPAIGATISAGILGGAGLGAIGIGALLLKDDPLLAQALTGFKTGVAQILREAAQPLRDPLIIGLDTILNGVQAVAPDLQRMFAGIAPFIQPLADGVRGFIEAFTPGLVDAVIASGPVLEQIGMALPDLGDALGDFLTSIAQNGPEAALIIGMIVRGIGDLIRFIGLAIEVTTPFFASVAISLSQVWDLIREGLDLIAILGAVVVGDFGAAKAWLQQAIGDLIRWLKGLWSELSGGAQRAVGDAIRWVKGLPGQIRNAVGNLGGLLYQAGRNVVQGLIDGIRSMFGRLGDVASSLAGTIRNYLPFSPAKEGPLAGRGNPYYSGQSIVDLLASGVTGNLGAARSAASDLAETFALSGSPLATPVTAYRSTVATPAPALLGWAPGATGDRLLDALREMIRVDYAGSPAAALGST